MDFTETVLESDPAFTLLRTNGKVHDFTPFAGFVLRAQKRNVALRILHSERAQTVSQFVSLSKAIAGINGGFYLLNDGTPMDWLVAGSKTIKKLENMNRPCISLEGNRVAIAPPSELLKATDVMQCGPLLLKRGNINTDYSDYKTNARQFDQDITGQRFPRTLFGTNETEYFFIVIDGRSKESAGLFLDECAELARKLGALDAVNLDGGGSSAMVVNGKLINNPRSTPQQAMPVERAVPAALVMFRIAAALSPAR